MRSNSVLVPVVGGAVLGAALICGLPATAMDVITEKSGHFRTVGEAPVGTPEEAVLDSLRLIASGAVDEWMAKWCERCGTPADKAATRAGMLRGPLTGAAKCLRPDGRTRDAMRVSRVVGDPARDPTVTLEVLCGEPAKVSAAVVVKVRGGGWRVRTVPFAER